MVPERWASETSHRPARPPGCDAERPGDGGGPGRAWTERIGPAGPGPGARGTRPAGRPRPGISENTKTRWSPLAQSHRRWHNAISACRCRDRAIGSERSGRAVWAASRGCVARGEAGRAVRSAGAGRRVDAVRSPGTPVRSTEAQGGGMEIGACSPPAPCPVIGFHLLRR